MVHSKLWLAMPDGSRCVINEIDACALEQFEEKRENVNENSFQHRRFNITIEFLPFQDNDFPHSSEFYPGQSLWGPLHCLEDAQWILCTKELKAKRKSKPQKITKVVVEKVETDSVGVHWQCRAYSKDGAGMDQAQPKFVVEGDDLKKLRLLNVFEPSTLQVGDRNFYVVKENENVISREQWRKQQREIFNIPKHGPRKSRVSINVTKPVDPKQKTIDRQTSERLEANLANNPVNNANSLMPPPQNPNTESSDDWDTEDTGSQSDTASV